MPTIKRRFQIQRHDWPRDYQIQVAFGTDDFEGAWGSRHDLPLDQRDNWPGATVLAEMKECWEAHSTALLIEFDEHRPLFGELVFDGGVSPAAALNARKR
jgi:hypothetical protein